MEHYFTDNPNRELNRKRITFRFLSVEESFISADGVFSKDTLDFGSRLLIETAIKQNISGDVLDLGCGIGYIGIMLKKHLPNINLTMSDVNSSAVTLAKENSALYKQNNRLFVSDGLKEIDDNFDAILLNPPIRTGKKNIFSLYDQSIAHLKDTGRLLIVIRVKQGAQSTFNYLKTFSQNVKIIEKDSGYWIILFEK